MDFHWIEVLITSAYVQFSKVKCYDVVSSYEFTPIGRMGPRISLKSLWIRKWLKVVFFMVLGHVTR